MHWGSSFVASTAKVLKIVEEKLKVPNCSEVYSDILLKAAVFIGEFWDDIAQSNITTLFTDLQDLGETT